VLGPAPEPLLAPIEGRTHDRSSGVEPLGGDDPARNLIGAQQLAR
jgi:hypothetical protein